MKISENKPHSVHLRLTDEQYAYCVDNAAFMGVGVTDYIRMSINSQMVASAKLAEALERNKQLGDLAYENAKNNIEHQL